MGPVVCPACARLVNCPLVRREAAQARAKKSGRVAVDVFGLEVLGGGYGSRVSGSWCKSGSKVSGSSCKLSTCLALRFSGGDIGRGSRVPDARFLD